MSNDLMSSLLGESVDTTTELPKDHEHPQDFTANKENLKDGALGEEAETGDEDDADLADLDPLDEAALLQYALSMDAYEAQTSGLSEQLNIVRLNRQTKLLNLSNRTSIMLDRKTNDPLYAKFNKFNSLRLKFRAAIVKKYGVRASSYARKLMSKASTANGPKK